MRGPSIQATDIQKEYPRSGLTAAFSRKPVTSARKALSGVSFEVQPGEVVGLLGPNGAGKTTLLKIASTMLYPSSGEMRIVGYDVARHPAEARRNLGLVTSDERSFYWRLTGRQNLEFFAALYEVPKAGTAARIVELLERLGLAHAGDKPFYTYSSGMKQKMAIARGLLASPSVILYDEPTRALDPLSTRNIREWLRHNREEWPDTAHLIATNQMDEAEQLCDRILVLNGGRVVASGTIDEIRNRLRDYEVHRIVATCARPQLLHAVPEAGLIDVTVDLKADPLCITVHTREQSAGLTQVLDQILRCGGAIHSCHTEKMPLEEIVCSIVEADVKQPELAEAAAR